jgi:hypothetical protein
MCAILCQQHHVTVLRVSDGQQELLPSGKDDEEMKQLFNSTFMGRCSNYMSNICLLVFSCVVIPCFACFWIGLYLYEYHWWHTIYLNAISAICL